MSTSRVLVASAVAAAFSLAVSAIAQGGPAPVPKYDHEKCYGISKAGKNDCQTKMSSCAGTSKQSAQSDAWVYVPKGTCEKIVNGSMQPKA
jgi:uncharacterized membrane protein